MVRLLVLALPAWFAVSVPATVVLGKLLRAPSATPRPTTVPQARDVQTGERLANPGGTASL